MKCFRCGHKGKDRHEDIYDCVEQWEQDEGIPRGTWIIDWLRRIREDKSKPKPFSGFKEWSKQF